MTGSDAQNGGNGESNVAPGGLGGPGGGVLTVESLTGGGGGGGGGGYTGTGGTGGGGGMGEQYVAGSGEFSAVADIIGSNGTPGDNGLPGDTPTSGGGNGGGGGGGAALILLSDVETTFSISGFMVHGGDGGTSSAGAGGGGGGAGLLLMGHGTVVNNLNGSLSGGRGGGGSSSVGGGGGAALFIYNGGTFRNEAGGTVAGGNGGTGGLGGDGGAGVLANGGRIENAATINGGIGGGAATYGSVGGRGGDGIAVYGTDIVNKGTIEGGTGGGAAVTFGTNGGSGGNGVTFIAGGVGGSLINEGTINGGHGGAGAAQFPGAGGYGVLVESDGTTLVNKGAINGPGPAAVLLTGDDNAVEIRAGSSFGGSVISEGSDNILRLGGDTDATFDLSNVGGQPFQFQGFALFEKTGTSTWTLLGAAHQTTPWTIEEGTLQVGNGGTTGSINDDIANEAALVFNRSNALLYDDVISGSGTLTQKGTGKLTLTKDQTYTGVTTIEAGTLQLGNGGTTGSVAGDIVNQAALIFSRSNDFDYDGEISGGGTFTKLGNGMLTFSADQTFTGATEIDGGALRINGLFASSTVTVNAGATLLGSGNVDGDVVVENGGIFSPGDPAGNFTVVNLVLNATSQVNFDLGAPDGPNDQVTALGNVTLDGVLNLSTTDDFTTGVYQLFGYGDQLTDHGIGFGLAPAGYNLSIDTSEANRVVLRVDYTGLQFWNGTTTTPDGVVHGGSGTWDATTANWTNENGNVAVAWDDLTAVFSGAAGGDVEIAEHLKIAGLQFATDGYHLLDAGGALILDDAATEFRLDPDVTATLSTVITGEGGINKTGGGTLVLAADNTFAGETTITAGTIEIAADASLGDPAGALVFYSGLLRTTATFETGRDLTTHTVAILETASGTTLTATGDIHGTGELVKQGEGTLHLTGSLQHTGATTVLEGTLASGDLARSRLRLEGDGAFSPGGDAAVSLTLGGLELNGGRLLFDFEDGARDHLTVADGLGQLNAATEFVFNNTHLSNGTYELIDGLAGGWDLSLLSYSGISPVNATFLLSEDGSTLFLSLYNGGVISGPVLQNSAPVGIPTMADFLVNGSVITGSATESNIINSLIFNPASILQIFNTLTVTSGELNVGSGIATLAGGLLTTSNTIIKSGPGSLVTSNPIYAGGGISIQEGSLLLNNNTIASNGPLTLYVNSILGGNGTIIASVINHGTVAPGHSPGLLAIDGSYLQPEDGTLQIEVASPTLFDRLLVTGTARLAGTLEALNFGDHRLTYGEEIPFLQAGEIRGGFSQVVVPDPDRLRGRFLKEDGVGSLLIAPRSYTLVAGNANERSLAGALDGFISARGDDRETVSIALDRLPEEAYSSAFLQMSPAFYQTLPNISIEQANARNQMLSQRFGATRVGGRGFQAIGLGEPLVFVESGKNVKELHGGDTILVPAPENRWGLWVQGNGIFSRITHTAQVPNHRYRSGGILTGVDYRWSETFLTGLYGGYQGVRAKYDGGGRSALDSAIGGVYATWQKGGFYSNAVVGGVYTDYDVRRPIAFGNIDRQAVGKLQGGQFNAYLDLGYTFKAGYFLFEPIVAGQYLYTGLDSFTETGARSLNLQVDRQRVHSLRTQLGGRVAWLWQAGENIVIIPEARAFWQHEYLHGSRDLHAALDGGAAGGFTTATSPGDRDSVFAGAGVTAQFGERWSVSCFYNADFARDDFTSQMVSGSIGWRF